MLRNSADLCTTLLLHKRKVSCDTFRDILAFLDKNFLVYAVDSNKVISYNNDDLTVVFLNQKIVWDDNTGINLKRRVIRPTYVPTKSSQVYDYTTFPVRPRTF